MNRTERSPRGFFNRFHLHAEGLMMFVLTILLVVDIFLGILTRYVHFNVVFATELGKYLFIWLCAVGISAAARDNQHVRIHFMARKLPWDPRITWIFTQAVFFIFSLFFLIWGIRLTWMHFSMGKQAMGFNFPMFIFTAAIPVGFALTCYRLYINIRSVWKGTLTGDPWEGPVQDEILSSVKEQEKRMGEKNKDP